MKVWCRISGICALRRHCVKQQAVRDGGRQNGMTSNAHRIERTSASAALFCAMRRACCAALRTSP